MLRLKIIVGGVLMSAIAVGGLAGCAAEESASPTVPNDGDYGTLLDEEARAMATQLGIADPPEVEVVRFIAPNETAVYVDCLNEAGYEFTAAPDGGLLWPSDQSPDIIEPMKLAFFVCAQQYPVDPRYSAPATDEQLRWMYKYSTTTLLECLAENGVNYSGDTPSEQVYVESKGEWSPYANLTYEEYEKMVTACPQYPDDFYAQPFW